MINSNMFSKDLMNQIRNQFLYVNEDPYIGERLYFDNAAGSLRLKSVLKIISEVDALPDTPDRKELKQAYNQGLQDIKTILNAQDGSVLTDISASQVMFKMTEAVIKHVPGNNVVVTEGDHPSSYDSAKKFSKEFSKELRVAKVDEEKGIADANSISKLIDQDTTLLSIIYASNVTGEVSNIKDIVKRAREIKPDLYIIVDGVQYIPHGIVDLTKFNIDGINFAPYKFFANRGIGIGFVSKRLAELPHHNLLLSEETSWRLGSPVPSSLAAISEIVNYVCWIGEQFINSHKRRELYVEGMNRINAHEKELLNRLLNGSDSVPGLRYMPDVRLVFNNTDYSQKELLIGLTFKNISTNRAVSEMEKAGIVISLWDDSSIYFTRQLKAMGVNEFIRITPMHYHTKAEIDKFLKIAFNIANM